MKKFLPALFLFTFSLAYGSDSVYTRKAFPQPMPWILFKTNEATLSTSARDTLQFIGNLLKYNKPVVLEIDGYADLRGKAEKNLSLSIARARACADYLISLGIDSSRLIAKGFGDTRPLKAHRNVYDVSSLSPAQVYSVNRRVEFRIVSFGREIPTNTIGSIYSERVTSPTLIGIPTYVNNASDCALRGNYDSARILIDYHLPKDAQAWYVKGFIYNGLYMKREKTNVLSPLRDTAANALLLSFNLNPSNDNLKAVSILLDPIADTYYKDLLEAIDSGDIIAMLNDYAIYKEIMKTLEPRTDFTKTDFLFFNKLNKILLPL